MTFIGRRRELQRLQDYYDADYPKTCAIYGRRRVGKTSLVQEFCKDKKLLKLDLGCKVRDAVLDDLSRSISDFDGRDFKVVREGMNDFSDVVAYIGSLEPSEKLVVFIDELPEALDVFDDVASRLKVYIDWRLKEQNIFLIVSGSSISGMLRELNDGSMPLFQRFPVQLKLSPLSYREAREFHPDMSEEDRIRMYSIASGVPMFHLMLSGKDAKESIKRAFLGLGAPLLNEAEVTVRNEFKDWTYYADILYHLSLGNNTIKLLSEKTEISKSYCSEIMRKLELVELVERTVPYGKTEKSTTFRIKDGLVMFYYNVLLRYRTLTESEDVDYAYDRMKEAIDSFYGLRFEDVCAQYVKSVRKCLWLGNWSGKVRVLDEDGCVCRNESGKVLTEDVDLDIVAEVLESTAKTVLVCECKFTRRRSGRREFEELRYRTSETIENDNIRYMMFSRSGFTDELVEMAEDRPGLHLELVTLEDISRWASGTGLPASQQPYKGA